MLTIKYIKYLNKNKNLINQIKISKPIKYLSKNINQEYNYLNT